MNIFFSPPEGSFQEDGFDCRILFESSNELLDRMKLMHEDSFLSEKQKSITSVYVIIDRFFHEK